MRIAYFVGTFPRISQTFILNQLTGLIDRGHTVHIYAERPNDDLQKHGIVEQYDLLERVRYRPSLPPSKVIRFGKAVSLPLSKKYPANPRSYLRAMNFARYGWVVFNLSLLYNVCIHDAKRTLKYDIIHAHFGFHGSVAAALRDMNLIAGRLVTTFHGSDLSKHLKRPGVSNYSFLAGNGDLFLPVSERWKQKLINIGFPENRIRVHHMGIDCNDIICKSKRSGNGSVAIVSVSRLVEKKGLEYGIRALHRCISSTNINVKYVIVGDGPLEVELKSLVRDLGLTKVVTFVGSKTRSQVMDILETSDILLAPSVTSPDGDQEGIPVAIMEAMAHGLPVISTWHSGIPELVRHGQSGILVPERDVESLSAALFSLIEDEVRCMSMGRIGRKTVETQFNISDLNDELEKHFISLSSGC